MVSDVLSTSILRSKISKLAEKRVNIEEQDGLIIQDDPLYATKRSQRKLVIEKGLVELCEKLTFDMVCKMESNRFIRGAYYICSQLLTRAYHQGNYMTTVIFITLTYKARNTCI